MHCAKSSWTNDATHGFHCLWFVFIHNARFLISLQSEFFFQFEKRLLFVYFLMILSLDVFVATRLGL